MIDPGDMARCTEAIRHGSRSFHAASLLLPPRVRNPALALYAFCRLADDAVDLQHDKTGAVLALQERLERAYAGRPRDTPADRAFAAITASHALPRDLPEALLEGFAWDAMERRYATLSELRAYSARVAAAVGAMMCVLMEVRDRDALARACDLGVAMQLTNIARDVAEDAAEGRLYLPIEWLETAGIDPDAFLADPQPCDEIRAIVRRVLREAAHLYARAGSGVAALPLSCRPGIFSAAAIYGGIGGRLRNQGHDPFLRRARTGMGAKLAWMALALLRTGGTLVMPRSALIYAEPLPETAFLVDAAARPRALRRDWSETVLASLSAMKRYDLERRAGIVRSPGGMRESA